MIRLSTAFHLVFFCALALPCSVASGGEPRTPLLTQFADPPAGFRPVIITHGWGLKNPQLPEWLADRRAGGVVLDATAGKGKGTEDWTDPGYLDDPAVFQKLRDTMDRLKREGRRVWLYDELGYPSGSAGGRVLAGNPEFAVRAVQCQSIETAGEPLTIAVENLDVLSCQALRKLDGGLAAKERLDLTAQARRGSFDWEPPPGTWQVCLFHIVRSDAWKRHNIHRRNVNIMDRRAVARFIELTHERYARELGPRLKDVELFFTDEPQLGAVEPWMPNAMKMAPPAVQWCDELPAAFEKKHGYPLGEALPAIFHHLGPDGARHRHHFYDVYSDLVAENFFGQIQDWCRKHGVPSSGHMLLEESLLFHPMFSGSMAKNWMRQDLPGVDLLWLPRYKTMAGWGRGSEIEVPEDFSCKFAASITALTGKCGVFSESYALANRTQGEDVLRRAKGIAGWQFSGGVTHLCTYSIQQQFSAEEFASFSDFAGRLALLSRRGKPVSDVAVLAPESSIWSFYRPPNGGTFQRYIQCNPEVMKIDRAFRNTCHHLLSNQRDFEVMTEELLEQSAVAGGRLGLNDQRFSCLVLPEARMLGEAAMTRIEEFVNDGGYLVFAGPLPSLSPAKGRDDSMRTRAQSLLAAHPHRTLRIDDPGRIAEIPGWIAEHIPPLLRWSGPPGIRIAHQREAGRHILLLANPSGVPIEGQLSCRLAGHASRWDPENGGVTSLGVTTCGQSLSVSLAADSATFLVIEPPEREPGGRGGR